MKNKKISMIAALSKNNVIGKDGGLPWHIKKDFSWFVSQTIGKTIVMGRKNYEDIIKYTKGKPLKDRKNIILTTKDINPAGFYVEHDINNLLNSSEDLMIIGGAEIYKHFLPYADQLILTEIDSVIEGDIYFPNYNKADFQETFRKSDTENDLHFDFVIYDKCV